MITFAFDSDGVILRRNVLLRRAANERCQGKAENMSYGLISDGLLAILPSRREYLWLKVVQWCLR